MSSYDYKYRSYQYRKTYLFTAKTYQPKSSRVGCSACGIACQIRLCN